MLDATLTDRARNLLTASGRSDVPPFMVMDVMAAAARIEAAGGHVVHMEGGQPAASAPASAIAAAPAAPPVGRPRHTRAPRPPALPARLGAEHSERPAVENDPARV